MTKNEKRDLIGDLLIETKTLKADLAKHQGNPSLALAERLIKVAGIIYPYPELFDDNLKGKVVEYIETYYAAIKGEPGGGNVFKLIKPLNDLVGDTLEEMYAEL